MRIRQLPDWGRDRKATCREQSNSRSADLGEVGIPQDACPGLFHSGFEMASNAPDLLLGRATRIERDAIAEGWPGERARLIAVFRSASAHISERSGILDADAVPGLSFLRGLGGGNPS